MNKLDNFINSFSIQEIQQNQPQTVVDTQINEISKQLDGSIDNFVNSFIIDEFPPTKFIKKFIEYVNSGSMGKIQKQNAKIILSLAFGKYLIKKTGISLDSDLYKILTNSQVVFSMAKSIN